MSAPVYNHQPWDPENFLFRIQCLDQQMTLKMNFQVRIKPQKEKKLFGLEFCNF